MQLIPTKGRDIERGNRILIGDERLDAIVRDVRPVGDKAVPDQFYLVYDTDRWRETVNPIVDGDATYYVYPRRQRSDFE